MIAASKNKRNDKAMISINRNQVEEVNKSKILGVGVTLDNL